MQRSSSFAPFAGKELRCLAWTKRGGTAARTAYHSLSRALTLPPVGQLRRYRLATLVNGEAPISPTLHALGLDCLSVEMQVDPLGGGQGAGVADERTAIFSGLG